MKVKLEDIIEAIEITDRYSEFFLDKKTGEVEWVSDMAMTYDEKQEFYDRLDEHGFYCLPVSLDIREYDVMAEFAGSRSGRERDRLLSAIRGKGAFRRFKDAVWQMGIDNEWYDYQAAAFRRKAIRWCEENDIEYE